MPSALTLDSIVTASAGQASSEVASEEVILNLETGMYYGLEGVGARVWSLPKEPCAVSQLCDVIATECNLARERCEEDLLALLSQLAEAQLIEVVDACGPETATPDAR